MRGRSATASFRVFELTINHQKYRKIRIIGSELSKCQESGAKHAYAGAHRVVENSLDCSIFQCDQSFFEFALRKKLNNQNLHSKIAPFVGREKNYSGQMA